MAADNSLENVDATTRELAGLTQLLAEHPETRRDFLRMTKKVKPDLPIPELELEDRFTAARGEDAKRIAALEGKLAQKDAMQALEERRKKLRDRGFNDDDIKGTEKVMLEKGITNHEAGGDYFEWMNQAAKPTPATGAYSASPFKAFDLKPFLKNPVQAAREAAAQAMADFRKPVRPAGL